MIYRILLTLFLFSNIFGQEDFSEGPYGINYFDIAGPFAFQDLSISIQGDVNLDETINLINIAGGVAVIAHPLRYKITATKLRKLIKEFKNCGGKAIEVITSHSILKEVTIASDYAKKYNLAASIGSDFHNEKTSWNKLGGLPLLPDNLLPVWKLWKDNN